MFFNHAFYINADFSNKLHRKQSCLFHRCILWLSSFSIQWKERCPRSCGLESGYVWTISCLVLGDPWNHIMKIFWQNICFLWKFFKFPWKAHFQWRLMKVCKSNAQVYLLNHGFFFRNILLMCFIKIIYVFLTIFLYLLKCLQSLIL